MRLLVDTHAWLWWILDDQRLSARARKQLASPRNEIFVSAASIWEVSVKTGSGRLRLRMSIDRLVSEHIAGAGFGTLPVTATHAVAVADLAGQHGDPFDRMLVAQAITEDLTLVTGDDQIARYPVRVLW